MMVNVIVSGVPGQSSVRCFQVENAHLLTANYFCSVLSDALDIPELCFVLICGGHVVGAHAPIARAGEPNSFMEMRIRRALPGGKDRLTGRYLKRDFGGSEGRRAEPMAMDGLVVREKEGYFAVRTIPKSHIVQCLGKRSRHDTSMDVQPSSKFAKRAFTSIC